MKPLTAATGRVMIVASGLAASLVLAGPAQASTFTVTTTSDGDDFAVGNDVCETASGNGTCTLRAAVQEASGHSGPDTASVPAGHYDLFGGTPGVTLFPSGSDPLTIDGAGQKGAGATVIDGDNTVQVMSVSTTDLTISDLRIEDGHVTGCCGGAGIQSLAAGTLTLDRVTVAGNLSTGTSNGQGTGIQISTGPSTLNLTDSTVSGNHDQETGSGGADGAGIFLGNANLNMDRSTVSGNTVSQAGAGGAGIGAQSTAQITLDIDNSTLSGNAAATGGGSTGGGILVGVSGAGVGSTVNLTNATISGNTAASTGAGISGDDLNVNVKNTILAGNLGIMAAEHNCNIGGTSTVTAISSIDGDTACGFGTMSGNQESVTAATLNLGALVDNGGPTETRAPGTGSPAINAGDNPTCAAAPISGLDQRGFARNVGVCDIGALESGSTGPARTLTVTLAGTGAGSVSATGISCGVDCTESYANGSPVVLTATPGAGSSFSGWTGCDAPSGASCTMSMTADKGLTATFTPIPIPPPVLTPPVTTAPTATTLAKKKCKKGFKLKHGKCKRKKKR